MPIIEINPLLNYLFRFIENWWWAILPFLLWKPSLFVYLWWRNECWLRKQKIVLLEIKIPKEILKPIRAMEQVMANIQGHQTSGPSALLQHAAVAAVNGVQTSVESLRVTLENNRNVMMAKLNAFDGVKAHKPDGKKARLKKNPRFRKKPPYRKKLHSCNKRRHKKTLNN